MLGSGKCIKPKLQHTCCKMIEALLLLNLISNLNFVLQQLIIFSNQENASELKKKRIIFFYIPIYLSPRRK